MRGAIGVKFFGVGVQLIGIDDRRIVLGAIVTIKPGENERDLVFARRMELFAGPGEKVDFTRLGRRAPCQYSCQYSHHDGGVDCCGRRGSHRALKNHSSNVKFAAFTTSRTFTMSSSTMRRKSSGEPSPGATARFLRFAETSGSRIDWLSAFSSLAVITGGVAIGAKMPLQPCISTLGKPASAMLGTSGSSAKRSAPVTASALTLPALTWGTVGGGSAIAAMVWPSIKLRIISLLLLYGIITPGMPDFNFNCSMAMVKSGEVLG